MRATQQYVVETVASKKVAFVGINSMDLNYVMIREIWDIASGTPEQRSLEYDSY